MPPRKRPAPAPENPSPASKLNSKDPNSYALRPKLSAEILKHLPVTEHKVYDLIYEAGGKGMWSQDVRNATGMQVHTASKILRGLVNKKLIKEVNDVRHRTRKIYMATDFEPATEITGGSWYQDGRLDTDAIAAARRSCLAQVQKLGVGTVDMIHKGIEKEGYAIDKIRDILQTMVLDKVLEEVKSTGEGEFAAIRSGRICYRVAAAAQGGMMEGIPCGVCPRIDECSPDGVISPSTCVYYKNWLQMDF